MGKSTLVWNLKRIWLLPMFMAALPFAQTPASAVPVPCCVWYLDEGKCETQYLYDRDGQTSLCGYTVTCTWPAKSDEACMDIPLTETECRESSGYIDSCEEISQEVVGQYLCTTSTGVSPCPSSPTGCTFHSMTPPVPPCLSGYSHGMDINPRCSEEKWEECCEMEE